jgi:ElaA protein
MHWSTCTFSELDPHTLYAVLRLRASVFVVEQACAYLDPDGLDVDAHHLLGWLDGALVAYARVLVVGGEVAIGRVIVAPAQRGTGLGRALMREAMALAWRVHGHGPLVVGAQAHLAGFYGSLGFVVRGERYLEDGIWHVGMRWGG